MRLNEVYNAHKDDIQFFLIYIHEAHPTDGWQTPQNLYDDVVYVEPQSDNQRADVANACQIAMDLQLPMLLDSIDNAVETAYVSSPIRLYVIDKDGQLTFNGAQGPQGFDLDKWDAAIRDILSSAEQAAE